MRDELGLSFIEGGREWTEADQAAHEKRMAEWRAEGERITAEPLWAFMARLMSLTEN